jgi:hypothetical protein
MKGEMQSLNKASFSLEDYLHITKPLLNLTRKMLVFHAQLEVILEPSLKHSQIVVGAALVADVRA